MGRIEAVLGPHLLIKMVRLELEVSKAPLGQAGVDLGERADNLGRHVGGLSGP
jgi:hypothetical protein